MVMLSISILLSVIICFVSSLDLDNTMNLIGNFLIHYKLSAVITITCWKETDHLKLVKYLSKKDISVSVCERCRDRADVSSLEVKYSHLGIILDLHCKGALKVLVEAANRTYFKGLHYWLLLSKSGAGEDHVPLSDEPFLDDLQSLGLPLDSHVTLARSGSGSHQFLLQDVYTLADNALTVTPPRSWSPGQLLPPPSKRDDFNNIILKTGVTVIDDPWEHFLDLRYRHLNTMSKLSYVLTSYMAETLNFRMELVFTDAWGYPINGTKWYAGIAGLLQKGIVEIGATTLLIKTARWDIVDYAAEAFPFVGNFMFLKPSLSEVSNIYTLPFTRTVWMTYAGVVAVLTVGLVFTLRAQQRMKLSKFDLPVKWSDAIVHSIGIVCQQGSPQSPETISSRIVFLFLLLLSVFLVTSYSAIIVALLQTSSSAINTVTELMDSQFRLSMRNITYSITYVNASNKQSIENKLGKNIMSYTSEVTRGHIVGMWEAGFSINGTVNAVQPDDTTDPTVRRLYFEKLYTQPLDKSFTSQEIGIANVRKGLHAFQGDADAYKVISDTFEEHEKCRYKEIVVFVTNVLAFPVRKGSPYKDHIARKARWIKEIGIIDREYKRWYHQKPKCSDNSKGFVSVRIEDFYPALLVLAYGSLLAVVVLLMELMCDKIKRECRPAVAEHRQAVIQRRPNVVMVQNKKQRWIN